VIDTNRMNTRDMNRVVHYNIRLCVETIQLSARDDCKFTSFEKSPQKADLLMLYQCYLRQTSHCPAW